MQVSFNTYKPYTQNSKLNNVSEQKQNKNINFTSGYGAEDWDTIDNPNLPTRTNTERWKNIAKGIKMMTIDQIKYMYGIYPKPPKPLFTPEEIKKHQEEFYEDSEPMSEEENLCGLTDEDFGEIPKKEVKEEPVRYIDTLDDIEEDDYS